MTERPAITEWDIFPFEGEIKVKELRPPVLPEDPRAGEPGGSPCQACDRPDEHYIWADEHWRIGASPKPGAVPFVMLETREHHDLTDLPAERAVELGPMLQRIDRAFMATGKFGRVHVNRWGDGGSHFHVWLWGRPIGNRQMLGVFLPVWASVLPPMDEDDWWDVIDAVAEGLAAEGGARHLRRPAT